MRRTSASPSTTAIQKQDEGKFAERYVAQVEPHDCTMVFIAKPVKLK